MSLTASNTSIHPDDTIVAVSSARGSGKRAIVRISGPNTVAAIGAVSAAAEQQVITAHSQHLLIRGLIHLRGVSSPLPATLYFFAGPKTYTGQDLAEIHTVGSPPLVERLVADLLNAGTRPARPGEFTMRAFLAGKKDLPQAEAVNAVIEADTDSDLQFALAQLAGGVTQPLNALREDLLNLLADLEAALDFSDEDIEFVGKLETLSRIDSALLQLGDLLKQLDSRSVSGRPVRIALAGLPNVGKSSLFNALAGSDALVSPTPGTTRDYLKRQLQLGGVAAELIDTAGWQRAEGAIAEEAQRLGREQAGAADVILWCVEAGSEFHAADEARLSETAAKLICVWTKCDLLSQETGDRRRETGDGRQETGDRRWETGDRRQETESKGVATGERLTIAVTTVSDEGTDELRTVLMEIIASLVRSPLAPSQSRCLHHVVTSLEELNEARDHVVNSDPPELTAASLRAAIDQLGEMTGAVYTNDLLDRIFSRFCIGK